MKQKEVPQFTEPLPLQHLAVPAGTIGETVVRLTDDRVHYELEAAATEDRIRYADKLRQTKVHPDAGKVHYLGGKVLGKAMSRAEVAIVADAAMYDTSYVDRKRSLAADNEVVTARELSFAKRKIAFLDEEQRKHVDTYLDEAAPPFFQRITEDYRKDNRSWADWLVNGADDDQLVNFLQWNVHEAAQRQEDPEFIAAVEAERAKYKVAVVKAVNDGWFNEDTLNKLYKIDQASVWVGDVLDMILSNVRGSTLPVRINIAPPEVSGQSLVKEVEEVLPHEFNHEVIQAVTDTEELGQRWIMEALTELSARIMRPDFSSAGYPYEQKLYGALMQAGSETLDMKLGTQAFTGGPIEKQAFYENVDKSWGRVDTLGQLSTFVGNVEKKLLGDGVSGLIAQQDAVYTAMHALLLQPELIFDKEHHN